MPHYLSITAMQVASLVAMHWFYLILVAHPTDRCKWQETARWLKTELIQQYDEINNKTKYSIEIDNGYKYWCDQVVFKVIQPILYLLLLCLYIYWFFYPASSRLVLNISNHP